MINSKVLNTSLANFQITKKSKRKSCLRSFSQKSRRNPRSEKRKIWKIKGEPEKKKKLSKGTKKSEVNLVLVRSTSTTQCSADVTKGNAKNQTRSKIKPVCYLMLFMGVAMEADRKTACLNLPSLRRKYAKRLGAILKTA